MSHARAALVLALAALALTPACKKGEEPAPIPVTASSAPTVVTADPAAAAAAAAAPTVTTTAVTPVPAAPAPTAATATTGKKGDSIDACCAALKAVEKSGRDAATKAKFRQASAVCPGIAGLVKDGKTPRSAALTQIKASLVGVSVPGECN